MKSVLISIRPQWCEKIASGKKTIEVRKSAPKEVPFKAYIYCTKDKPYLYRVDDDNNFELTNTLRPKTDGYVKDYNEQNGKVIGEFICDKVYLIKNQGDRFVVANEEQGVTNEIARQSCLDYDDMVGYLGNKDGYGWHIADLKIYDKPKELSEFRKPLDRVWGSYCNDYCDRGCISFGSTDYSCNDYWKWEKGLTRPPQSWCYVESLGE